MVVKSQVNGDIDVRGKAYLSDEIVNRKGSPLLNSEDADPSRVAFYSQPGTTADETGFLAVIGGTNGILRKVVAGHIVACAGSATVEIDIKQAAGGESSATVLDSVITLDSSDSNYEVIDGTLDASLVKLNADDVVEVTVDATVGTGTLGSGLFVVLYYDENYVS